MFAMFELHWRAFPHPKSHSAGFRTSTILTRLAFACMFLFFFFNDTATTEFSPLPLHDPLPICLALDAPHVLVADVFLQGGVESIRLGNPPGEYFVEPASALRAIAAEAQPHANGNVAPRRHRAKDRKSTRLNSSHSQISYAVFCL